jgi:hypothetical protein
VSCKNSQNKNKVKPATKSAKPASKETRIPENPTAAGVRDSNWNDQYEDALSKCWEDSFASLVGGERIHNWMKTACVKVDHYESSTLSRSEYDYSVGSSSWKSHNIEKVHSLVEVFNKQEARYQLQQKSWQWRVVSSTRWSCRNKPQAGHAVVLRRCRMATW